MPHKKLSANVDINSEGRYPIRTVSHLTGVNSITLRTWERRYGLIKPVCTAKGHRLYVQNDIDLIQQIFILLAKGIPIGQVREHLGLPVKNKVGGQIDLSQLVQAIEVPVFIGGYTAIKFCDVIVNAEGIPLGAGIQQAIKRMDEELGK